MMWSRFLFKLRMHWRWLPMSKSEGAVSYAETQNVAVLMTKSTTDTDYLIEQLKSEHKSVYELSYIDVKEAIECSAFEQLHKFSSKDINAWGLLSGRAVCSFLSREYDLLINTEVDDVPCLEQIVLRSKVRLKVGLCPVTGRSKPGYQLLIRNRGQDEGLRCLYTYLRLIRS